MKHLTGLIAVALLAGCANPNTDKDFLCEAQAGSPCTTISAVDGTGAAGVGSVRERPEDTAVKSLAQNPLFTGKGAITGLPDGGFPYNAAAYRSPEVVGTLWIAPILNESGIMHEARFVHFVIQEGKWRQ